MTPPIQRRKLVVLRDWLNNWWWHTFRSLLRNRSYRLYFLGQLVSMSGSWMQTMALNWLTFELTHSAAMLGLVSFAGLLPSVIFSIAGGAVADRANPRRILVFTQILETVQAVLLAALTLANAIAVWQIVVLAFILGTLETFTMPARQVFVQSTVAKEDIANAVGLNASLSSSSRILGPALGVALLAIAGAGVCFLVNAATFLVAIATLLLIKKSHLRGKTTVTVRKVSTLTALKDVLRNPVLRNAFALAAIVSMFGLQYFVLLPSFAAQILHGEAAIYGTLLAWGAAGSLLGAISLASLKNSSRLPRLLGVASLTFSITLAVLAVLVKTLAFALPVVALIGYCITLQLSASQSVIQQRSPEDSLGRILGLNLLVISGSAALGSLFLGWLAKVAGVDHALLIASVICACAASLYLLGCERRTKGGK